MLDPPNHKFVDVVVSNTITVTCTDKVGNTSSAATEVSVPRKPEEGQPA